MASDHELLEHRSALVATIAERLRQRLGTVQVLLSGAGGEEQQAIVASLDALDITPSIATTSPAGLQDLIVHLGPLRDEELAQWLDLRRGAESIVLVSLPYGDAQVELVDQLRRSVAIVRELAQTAVDGSVISDLGQGMGGPEITMVHPDRTVAPGAAWQHVLTLGYDVEAVLLPAVSVRAEAPPPEPAPPSPPREVRGRRLPGAVTRRLRPAAAPESVQLGLRRSDAPAVSIIVGVHGDAALAGQCLAALPAAAGDTPYEVIVVDLGVDEAWRAWLEQVVGIRLVREPVEVADLVLLLAPDTILQPGAVTALVDRAMQDPSVGVVGSKVIAFDRTLIEAGEVVWSDGSRTRIGRGDRPDLPEHDVPKAVDCCAGAALLVRTRLLESEPDVWRRSPRDVDLMLCLRARARDARVFYEPNARVIDLDPDSGGPPPDLTASFDLAGHPAPGESVALAATREATGRILIYDHALPTPDRDGGSFRMLGLVRLLSEAGWAIWFLPANGVLVPPTTRTLLELGVEVIGHHRDRTHLLGDLGPGLDAIILSRRSVAWPVLESLQTEAPTVPIVFDTVDLQFLREEALAAMAGDATEIARARLGRWRDLALCEAAAQTWVVSETERDLLQTLRPGADIRLVPIVHDPRPTPAGWAERRDVVFVGGFAHPPNVDAVIWLVDEILPRLASRRDDLVARIVGAGLPDDVRSTLPPNARAEGWVPDLSAIYGEVRLAIAPMRYGAGVKTKITDALAHGLPVVSTPVGVEGFAPEVAALVEVASTADDFVTAILRLYDDEAGWGARHRQAPDVVAAHYGTPVVERALSDALAGLRRSGPADHRG